MIVRSVCSGLNLAVTLGQEDQNPGR